MFVDRTSIYCRAGDGGDGCMSFRRESHVPRGGPNGGDGGDGGDVIIRADVNVSSLSNIVGHKHWNAGRGQHGMGSLMHGKNGEDVLIVVPPGTIVRDLKRGHVLKDLNADGMEIVLCHGGRGGRGNRHFATATHQTPREYEPGGEGEYREVMLELKLIADVGLIGKPNAGKSTLLSRMSAATPEIADYPFTTKYPNLGMVREGWDREFVLADIPGLIEGASQGVGLGHEFLRHVERTRLLVHLVEPMPTDQTDPIDNYKQIREELRLYEASLAERPEIICVSKCELPDAAPIAEMLSEELGKPVLQISAATGWGLEGLQKRIFEELAVLGENEEG
ncbi:GTPase ObgE [Stratiformator vulcanicus]|uniref:GTPase Obg n=1 Tax=Stratiformator vulcanicus TaxID=2527980 RepID=A0A517QVJ9_9PLAN|nr:GTPase ObgE [Stratiformator vulcanicus]QDT35679.1 GTPase Obg [Stratiformator vulcanicus]